MRKWQLGIAKIAVLFITSCTTPTVLVKPNTIWPDLPNVPTVDDIELKQVKFQLPGNPGSFIALDQTNWANFQYNWQSLKELNLLYKDRIDQINIQRQQWRDLNKGNANAKSDAPR